MAKLELGNLLWLGTPPVPPEPKPLLLRWIPPYRAFKPYGLPVKKLASYRDATPDFVSQTKSMIDKIHPGIQAALIKYGFAVMPARDIYNMSLWLSWDGPRGHNGRLSWKHVSGLCMFDGHLLLICECRQDHNDRYIFAENRQGVFNHELGHCLAEALGKIDASPEFLACVAKDVENLSVWDRAIYRYLLQPGLAGPSEVWAECFAAIQGQGCFPSGPKDMPVSFSHSYQFVSEQVGRLTTLSPQEKANVL